MAGVLDFQAFLGGPDQVKIEQVFPSSSKTLTYDFGQNIAGWTFRLDSQTVIADPIAFDRNTGQPNFAGSTVVGTFPYTLHDDFGTLNGNIRIQNTATGLVSVRHPAQMYNGPILPDARAKVPITVVGFTWATTTNEINTHRIAKVQAWEPSGTNQAGDPTTSTNYSAIA
jgi:hypothetical protein